MDSIYKRLRDYLKATLAADFKEVYSQARPNDWKSPCIVLVKATDDPVETLRGHSGTTYAEFHVLTYATTRQECHALTEKVKLALIGHGVVIPGVKSVRKQDFGVADAVELVEKNEFESHGFYRVSFAEAANLEALASE